MHSETLRLVAVAYDHPDAAELIAGVQQEYVIRYGEPDRTPVDPTQFAPPLGLFVVVYLANRPVACGGWRSTAQAGVAELKRMYVTPPARGRGLARAVLAELERTARRAGHQRLILETGMRQPEAMALYAAAGYVEVPSFGYYQDAAESVHLGKSLLDGSERDVPTGSPG